MEILLVTLLKINVCFSNNNAEDTLKVDTLVSTATTDDIEQTLFYSAKDTQHMDIINQKLYLRGKAMIEYGDTKLEAERIWIDWDKKIVTAKGILDKDSNWVGLPVFTQSEDVYNTKEIAYNFQTRKAKIKEFSTKDGDGYILGKDVKRVNDSYLYISDAQYTTCDLPEPHYSIKTNKLKTITGKSVISGPFYLSFEDFITPIGFFFGMFPMNNKRTSGIIFPKYGESQGRGFYLRDGGFYINWNDYIDVTLLGEVYTLGGWGLRSSMRYSLRYRFNGSIGLSVYNRFSNAESNNTGRDFQFTWNHSTVSKKNSRLSANVSLSSSTYNQNNSRSVNDYLSSSSSSNITYTKKIHNTPLSISTSIRQNQNFQTEIVNFYPTFSLSSNRIYPFRRKGKKVKNNPISQLNLSYSGSFNSLLTNDTNQLVINLPFEKTTGVEPLINRFGVNEEDSTKPIDFYTNLSSVIQEVQYGFRHSIPISTSITILKYFNLSPNFRYNEYWYPRKFSYELLEDNTTVRVTEESGLARAYDYSAGAGLNTRLYLFLNLGKITLRNTISPSISYSYNPDFTDPKYGFYQRIQYSEDPEDYQLVSRFQRTNIPIPGGNPDNIHSSSISLDNFYELKIPAKADSTGSVSFTKIPLFRLNASYSLTAESFNLSDIRLTTTSFSFLKDKVSTNLRMTFDPYTYKILQYENNEQGIILRQERIDKYAWQTGNGLGTLKQAGISVNTRFKAPGKESEKSSNSNAYKETTYNRGQNYDYEFTDFNIPWSLNINYNANYTKTGYSESIITQQISFSGDINVTPKWKVKFNSGWDFEAKNFSFTRFSIFRDLHCWEMALNWTPFGFREEYDIYIAVKSSVLQDLKYQKRNSWYDR